MGPLAAMYQLAQFAGPTCAACLVLTGILYTVTKLFASTSTGRVESAISSAEYEHTHRIDAERRADRYLEAARYWNGMAHRQSLLRVEDRQKYRMHEKRAGVEPLILDPVADLPPFFEDHE